MKIKSILITFSRTKLGWILCFVENCSIFSEEKKIIIYTCVLSINKTVNKLFIFIIVGIAGSGTCLIHELTPILK